MVITIINRSKGYKSTLRKEDFKMGSLIAIFVWVLVIVIYAFCFLVGLIGKVWEFIRDVYETSVENKKKENELNDELAIKVYDSGVDLYNETDLENVKKINILKKMCNTEDINKLRELHTRAGKILEKAEYELYMKLKKKALVDYKQKYSYDNIKTRLVDDDISEVKKLLKYSNVKGTIEEPSKNMKVSFNITYNKSPKILEKNAIIDGSLKITVSDKEGNIIADGYCIGDTFEEYKDIFFSKYNVGLLEKQYEVICITKDKSKVKANTEYVTEIKPVKLWLIEADNIPDDILKQTFKNTSNSNITYNHKPIIDTDNKVDTYDDVDNKEKYYCERCDKRISKEEYEQYGDLCEECFDEVYYDFDGNFREDYWKYY